MPRQPRFIHGWSHKLPIGKDGGRFRRNRREEAEKMREADPVVMLAFTKRGYETMERLAGALLKSRPDVEVHTAVRSRTMPERSIRETAEEFTGRWFARARALVFFGAAGIAVRCIAPFVKDKFLDPAVLVIDESGRFCISLLSGHVGGGNDFCLACAGLIGAVPVITTATDGRGQFAVDVFARRHQMTIGDRAAAKEVSARLLDGECLKVYREPDGAAPGGDREDAGAEPDTKRKDRTEDIRAELADYPQLTLTADRTEADILITVRRMAGDRPSGLYLFPRRLCLGIGCRRHAREEAVAEAVRQALEPAGLAMEAVRGIASIDLKAEEPALLAFSRRHALPFSTCPAEELMRVPGAFSSSEFVRKTTGADNVCERSAVWLARRLSGRQSAEDVKVPSGGPDGQEQRPGSGRLLVGKTVGDGVTVAVAEIG